MWFSLFIVVLILAITFYQGLYGLFSSFIMCVCTVLAASLAFGMYEDVYFSFLVTRQPDHGRAIAFMAIFLIALLVMRVVVDLIITKNVEFHPYLDRAGGGVFGFISAMVIIGCLAITIQMLPFYPSFLGFSRYAVVTPEGETADPSEVDLVNLNWNKAEVRGPQSLWFNPDGFTVGLVSYLSDNALNGGSNFSAQHPEFLKSLNAARWGIPPKSKHVVPADALKIVGYWDLPPDALTDPQWFEESGRTKVDISREKAPAPQSGMKRIVVRGTLSGNARDGKGYRFNSWQVQLFGSTGSRLEVFDLYGANDPVHPEQLVRVALGRVMEYTPKGQASFDWVFEVPDSDQFTPMYLEYKQNARAELLPTLNRNEEPPPPLTAEGGTGEDGGNSGGTGGGGTNSGSSNSGSTTGQDRVSGVGPMREETKYSSALPLVLTNYGGNPQVVSGELRGGNLVAQLDDNWQPIRGDKSPLRSFVVPPNMTMLQLNVEKLDPQSWIGNLYGAFSDKTQNFYIIDSNNRNHRPVGSYSIAEVGGKKWIEILFLDQDARSVDYGLPKPRRIQPRDLKGDYTYVFLFHLPPGTKPIKLQAGRTPVDLRSLNIAPAPSNVPAS